MNSRLLKPFRGVSYFSSKHLMNRPWCIASYVPVRKWHPPSKDYDPEFGDYPKLPWSSIESRSPYAKWDDPIHRRNFGEPIHEEFEIQDAFFAGEHDPAKNLKTGLYGQAWIFMIFMGFAGLTWLTYDEMDKVS